MCHTETEKDHVDSNDDVLSNNSERRVFVQSSVSVRGARVVAAYSPMGKNCEMPPRIISTPTARLTMRLEKYQDQLIFPSYRVA